MKYYENVVIYELSCDVGAFHISQWKLLFIKKEILRECLWCWTVINTFCVCNFNIFESFHFMLKRGPPTSSWVLTLNTGPRKALCTGRGSDRNNGISDNQSCCPYIRDPIKLLARNGAYTLPTHPSGYLSKKIQKYEFYFSKTREETCFLKTGCWFRQCGKLGGFISGIFTIFYFSKERVKDFEGCLYT